MPVNAAESASLLNLAKSFTSSYEAHDRLSAALREHLGVTPRDSFWLSDDGVDDVRGPVVIYRLERDCYDASGCGIAKCGPGTADEPFFRATYALTADGYTFGEPVKVRRVTAYEAILDAGAGGPDAAADETEVPEWLAHALAMAATLTKAAGHRYIRRVPKAGGGYRYFYKVSGGGGLGHEDEMKVGAKFRIAHGGKEGHFEIVGKDDKGNLRIKHDESGHESTLSPAALRGMLRAEHAQSLKTHREKLAADIKAADDPKAKVRLLAEAGKYEHTRDLAEPGKSEPAKETAAPKADGGMNAAQPAAAAKHREESLRHAAAAAHWGQNAAKAGSADDRNESERVQRMHGRAASSHRRAADLLEREAPAGHHLEMHAGANADGQLADEEALFQAKRLGMPAAPAKEPAAHSGQPAAKKPEPEKGRAPKAEDVNITHSLTPDEAKKLDYRLRSYDVGTQADNLGDELRLGVKGDDAKRWVSNLTDQVKDNPFATRLDVPDIPKGVTKTEAKGIVAKVEALKSSVADRLNAAGHHEAHDPYDTHKIHTKAYQQVAENIDRALGAKVGARMLNDTAGVGLRAVSDAALHGNGKLSQMAAKYAEQGRKDAARDPDGTDYYKRPAYSGGRPRIEGMTAGGILSEAGYADSRARTAKDSADIADAFEAKGFDAGAKFHRAYAKQQADLAEYLRGAAKEKTDKANAEHDAALKAEKDRKDAEEAANRSAAEAHLRAVAKPGEDVVHITTGGGSTPVLGKVHHGEYAVHRPVGGGDKGFSVTHMGTGTKLAGVSTHAAGKALADKLHEAVPGFGKKLRSAMSDAELRTASDIVREHGKVQKSMSTVTTPERDLAKSLAASHRAAAEAQPDAGAKDAHKAAAQACDAAAEADSTRDFRKALGAAERIGGLIKAWSGMPDTQRRPFAEFHKSMTSPGGRLGDIRFAASNATGDALGHLPAVVAGSRPPAEVHAPIDPEPTTYSAQRGAVNSLRKSMGAFYGRLSAGASQAQLGVRCPPEVTMPDGER